MDHAQKFEPLYFTPPDGSVRGQYWKDSPSPPAPAPIPDPANQVRAQAAATPSAYTPQGSRVYSGDPNTPGSFRYTETYSPSGQRQFDTRNAIAENLLGRAEQQIPQIPATPFEFNGATDPTTNHAYRAQEELLNRSFDRDRTALEQRLANQGLPMGGEAYERELENFDRSKAASLTQAAAGANQQGYNQAIGTRQQNYNELAALLGGQQLSPVATAPGAGAINTGGAYANQQDAINRNYQNQLGQYNAGVASNNSLQSGLFGLGSTAAGLGLFAASDVRLKSNIERIGTHPLGIGMYEYDIFGRRETGVMAQELIDVMPEAVAQHPDGYLMVDYAMIGGRP